MLPDQSHCVWKNCCLPLRLSDSNTERQRCVSSGRMCSGLGVIRQSHRRSSILETSHAFSWEIKVKKFQLGFHALTMYLCAVFLAISVSPLSGLAQPSWKFVQNGTSGMVALESIFINPNLAVIFDRATNGPLQIDGHAAWGALWNMKTNQPTPLRLISDAFCGTAGFLSNGTLVWGSQSLFFSCSLRKGQHCRSHSQQHGSRRRSHGNPSHGALYFFDWRILHVLRRPGNSAPCHNSVVSFLHSTAGWLSGTSPTCPKPVEA